MQRQLLFRASFLLSFAYALSACTLNAKLTRSDIQYRESKLEAPQMCMALSGGGMRSASFSIGVLRQLYLQDELASFDVASGASGGSWALLWLDSHAARTPLIEVFGTADADSSEALKQVEQSHLLNWLGRGMEGLSGLLRAARSAQYAELNTAFGNAGFVAHYTAPSAVVVAAREKSIPMPIFVATALHGRCNSGDARPGMSNDDLKKRSIEDQIADFMPMSEFAIEINPRTWGNSFFGYSDKFPYKLSNIESWAIVSGAFIDYPKYGRCRLMSAVGATWGANVTLERFGAKAGSEDLFLVDGGFTDNLAGYPLVRRRCSMTVFIDAERDEDLQFIGYRRLREGVKGPLQARLDVPQIENWIAGNPNGRTKAAVDGSSDIVARPVMLGTITYADGQTTHVLYMKLSMNPDRLNDYEAPTRAAFEAARLCENEKPAHCNFPHTDTFKTNYSEKEFRAQRELGETMTKLYLVPALTQYRGSFAPPPKKAPKGDGD